MKETILVVDDEENVRLLCREVLGEQGYRVIEAEDGREAIRRIEEETPDLVVLDIQMAQMDGMQALPQILRRKRDIPVILYTGYSRYQEEFMSWAADAYVVKSSDFTELKEKIQELLSAKTPMKTPNSLDVINYSILRILSTYEEMTPLELWYQLGEDDRVKERVTEAGVRARLELLRKKGFVERIIEAGVDGETGRPIYRIARSDVEP